jgi:hypothetical protein
MPEPFAFDVVYDYIWRKLVADGLPRDGILAPSATIIFIEDCKVYRATPVPVGDAFTDEREYAAFVQIIRNWTKTPQDTPTKDFCMVVAVESYIQWSGLIKADSPLDGLRKARVQLPESLAGHPDSVEVVAITIYHRSGTKMGALLINEDRTLTYQPLFSDGEAFAGVTSNSFPSNPPELH